jgi:integrase
VPRGIHRLSAPQVRSFSAPGMIHDGGGLYLQLAARPARDGAPAGATKSWLLRFTSPAGKRREMGLGSVDDVSLKDARDAAAAAYKQLKAGIDPIDKRRLERAAEALEAQHARTFKQAALEYLETKRKDWGDKHAKLWLASSEAYVFPHIGALPIAALDTSRQGVAFIKQVLKPIWHAKPETGRKVRQRLEAVLEFGAASGYRGNADNPARLARVEHILGESPRQVRHHPALPFEKVGAFMAELRGLDGLGALALQHCILTTTRTHETLGCRKTEFDLDGALWVIPKERMKGRRDKRKEHRVPLSRQTVKLLRKVFAAYPKSPFVFPGLGTDTHLSGMAMLKVLERMGRDDITVHGFRSTFRDWAADATDFPREVAEAALAHALGDKTEAAYRRGDALAKRQKLMQEWADYCDRPPSNQRVVTLIRKHADA